MLKSECNGKSRAGKNTDSVARARDAQAMMSLEKELLRKFKIVGADVNALLELQQSKAK